MNAPENARTGPGANQPKIALRGLCKTFGGMVVLDGLDLEIGTGESVVVIGCSGVGKSVMLKCLLGLLRPDAGSVTIDGEELTANRSAREGAMRKIGMLFQNAALFDSLPVWENVAFGLIQGHGTASAGGKENRRGDARPSGSRCECRRSLSGCALWRNAEAGRARPRHRHEARDHSF